MSASNCKSFSSSREKTKLCLLFEPPSTKENRGREGRKSLLDQPICTNKYPCNKHGDPYPSLTLRPRSPTTTSLRRLSVAIVVSVLALLFLVLLSRCVCMCGDDDGSCFWKVCMWKVSRKDHQEATHLSEQSPAPQQKQCSGVPQHDRFDCYPESKQPPGGEAACIARGCCWAEPGGFPACFYPEGFGYAISGGGHVNATEYGYNATLERKHGQMSQYGGDIDTLVLQVYYETEYRLRVKIIDPAVVRYEVPIQTPVVQKRAEKTAYHLEFANETFGFTVIRSTSGRKLFETATGMIYANQFLQLSAFLPSDNVYGLGEHTTRLKLDFAYSVLTLFSGDVAPVPENPFQNLYGVHPFYLCLEENSNAHGVFLLNSNAMEVGLQPSPSISYRTIGGILDFYFFLGPTPEAVVQQYTEVIGRSFMPPYWALGFHLCRWGYGSVEGTLKVVDRMREKGIPQDTQWNDIEYAHQELDFTFDNETFGDVPSLVKNLHTHGQKYIIITDPGISSTQTPGTYPPFDEGLKMDIFIKNSSGKPLVGKVWPGPTVFPDFSNSLTASYWKNQISRFHQTVQFDGLWIDMNEVSNFVNGSLYGCLNNSLDLPPFVPGVLRGYESGLTYKTVCLSANQSLSQHYDLHSVYGLMEANATMKALIEVLGRRSLVISRSNYPSSGVHGGHWLGDNASKWPHMAISISGILQFSLFGIPMVGPDICGFKDNAEEELCTRWMQLGAFYPFSRNHNSRSSTDQDPAVFSEASANSSRDALLIRYSLLPFLYTLFHSAHTTGSTVARPLFFEFPDDYVTWDIDQQFMWGSALLISPVLEEGAVSVVAYFPEGRWFALRTGAEVIGTQRHVVLDAPSNFIPLHVRGGSVVPMHEGSATTTVESRKNPYSLLVALSGATSSATAEGSMFLDDGDSLNTYERDQYTFLEFRVAQGVLTSSVVKSGYAGAGSALLGSVRVLGLAGEPSHVTVNGAVLPPSSVTWNGNTKVLDAQVHVTNLNLPFTISWK